MSSPGGHTNFPSFLWGGGELGRLMRGYEWSTSPLGAPSDWPQGLKSAASICLGTAFPIAIYWGPELALLYNDAWSPIPGEKHPHALGRPGREVWPEIWDDIGPLFAQVQKSGEGVWQQDQLLPMRRHGYTEECYFNFTFSPIRGDDGAVEGIFNAVVETTFRVIGERRERALRHVAERVSGARSEDEVFAAAIDALSAHREDVPFALIYRRTDEETAELAAAAGVANAKLFQTVEINAAKALWPLRDLDDVETTAVTCDVSKRVRGALAPGPWPEPVTQALVMHLQTGAAGSNPIYLVTGISPRRALDDEYSTFMQRIGGHVSAALANAHAYEEERRRAEALAELDRAKTLFFSNVSHEFRTPLTLMMGPLEDVLAESDQLNPVQRERLETAMRNSERLLKLVNALLDFSRIEAGRTQARFEPVDLGVLTADISSAFRSTMERAGLRFDISHETLRALVYIDRDLWEKVLLNLLSNAFKFTFEGGIGVDVRDTAKGAEVIVTDTGVGIPEEELPRLFDRFHRVGGQRSRSFEGSGIGLALVKELVRLHGGEISAESTPGRGSRFKMLIPYGSQHLPADQIGGARVSTSSAVRSTAYVGEAARWLADIDHRAAPDSAGAEFDGRTVLVADDNADMRDYLQRLLAERWRVILAEDGEAALNLLRSARPALVITDVMMPRLDGFGLLRAIREDEALRDVPVIMLSARAGEEARVEGLDAGADDYLIKPFSARELLARVSANLELARLRTEMTRELRESEARFRNMADHAPVMVWVTETDGSCSYLSKSWYEFTGQTPETGLGFGWLDAIHPEDRPAAEREFEAANAEQRSFKLEYRLRHKDGEYRWAIDAATPRTGPTGAFLGYIGSVFDITERKMAEERTETLLAEVNHRSKNMLSLVQAVARNTASRSPGDFLQRFGERLQSLAASQDLLVNAQWGGVSLHELVRAQLGHFRDLVGSRILLNGPTVEITPSAAQSLGMALHELGTNAGKYGALSNDTGRVEIDWAMERPEGSPATFSIVWREHGGPEVTAPTRRGFGADVIDRILARALQAAVTVEFASTGLHWRIECDARNVVTETAAAPPLPLARVSDPGSAATTNSGARVLIVEDEPIIAMDVAARLEDAGYQVLGPAGSVAEALYIINHASCEAVVLDINLGRETAEPVAAHLRKLGVPFVSVSGYSTQQQPEIFKSAPSLTKPVTSPLLLQTLSALLGPRDSAQ